MEITLYSGGLQPSNVVTTINAPAFAQMPAGIQWAGRYFFLVQSPQNAYLEGVLWQAYPRA